MKFFLFLWEILLHHLKIVIEYHYRRFQPFIFYNQVLVVWSGKKSALFDVLVRHPGIRRSPFVLIFHRAVRECVIEMGWFLSGGLQLYFIDKIWVLRVVEVDGLRLVHSDCLGLFYSWVLPFTFVWRIWHLVQKVWGRIVLHLWLINSLASAVVNGFDGSSILVKVPLNLFWPPLRAW